MPSTALESHAAGASSEQMVGYAFMCLLHVCFFKLLCPTNVLHGALRTGQSRFDYAGQGSAASRSITPADGDRAELVDSSKKQNACLKLGNTAVTAEPTF